MNPSSVSSKPDLLKEDTVGGLLGVFPGETFSSTSLILEPGEKFVAYSDGMEDMILQRDLDDRKEVAFTAEFQRMVRRSADGCAEAMSANLDRWEGSLAPSDDQTCIIIERSEP